MEERGTGLGIVLPTQRHQVEPTNKREILCCRTYMMTPVRLGSIYPSVHLSRFVFYLFGLSVCLSIYVCLSVRLFVYLSMFVCLPVRLAVRLLSYVFLYACLLYLSFLLSVCLSVCLSFCLSRLLLQSLFPVPHIPYCSFAQKRAVLFSVSVFLCFCLSVCLSAGPCISALLYRDLLQFTKLQRLSTLTVCWDSRRDAL